jgi:N6-adenosine-specific RNA methylase IME4/ParB-like chromosome segregation protein Spo0J
MIKKISEIVLNDNRRKVDAEKVKELAESIKQLGLINPITINSNNVLIAGNHRLEAFKLLGKDEIEISVLDLNNLLAELAEIDENLVRNELHWTDADKQIARRKIIYLELYPETKAGGDRKSDKIKTTNCRFDTHSFSETTAKITSQSERTVERAVKRGNEITEQEAEVLKTIDAPKSYGDILIKQTTETRAKVIDALKVESKPVEIIIQEIKKEEKKELHIEKKKEYEQRIETVTNNEFKIDIFNTTNKFRVIYADPAWSYNDKQDTPQLGGASKHYNTMTVNEICNLPVNEISEKDSVLFLWVTSPLLEDAFAVIKSWGFKYKTSFVWDKVKHNMGHYNSVRHEFLLIATKGSCVPDNKKLYDSVQTIERNDNHSEKPIEFLDIIDDIYNYGNKLEMFCRNIKKEKWYGWGNEI